MAKLERYDIPQVKPEALHVGPGSMLRTTAHTGTEAISEGLNALAASADRIARIREEERINAENLAISDRDLQFAQEAVEILHGKRDAQGNVTEQGYLSRSLTDALDTASTHERLEAARQKHMGTLPTQRAQQAFDLRTRVRAQAYYAAIESHASAERKKAYLKNIDGSLSQAKADARAGYYSLEQVEAAIALHQQTERDSLIALGVKDQRSLDDAARNSAVAVYDAVLSKYAADERDHASGRIFAESLEGLVDSDALDKWKAFFDKGTKAQRILDQGEQAWTGILSTPGVVDPVTKRFNVEAAIAQIGRLPNELEADVRKDLEARVKDASDAQTAQDKGRIARLSRGARATGKLDTGSLDYQYLDDLGKNAAEDIAQREARERRAATGAGQLTRAQLDRVLLDTYHAMGPPKMLAEMTDEDLEAEFGRRASEGGMAAIKRARQNYKNMLSKAGSVTMDEFTNQVNTVANAIYPDSGREGSVGAQRKRESMVGGLKEWYFAESGDGEPPTQKDVAIKLGEIAIQRKNAKSWDLPLGLSKESDFNLKLGLDARGEPLPLDQQKFKEYAAAYLDFLERQPVDRERKITDGKTQGILAPKTPMPDGWWEVK